MPLSPGQVLSAYEILGPLGAGGMGEVYRARDTRLEREVAIKVLPEELADDEERLRRFEREARTISRLNHPRICTLHDVGDAEGIPYLVLEYLEGETLADRIARGPIPVPQALRLASEIAEALDAAHSEHLIHRDLKPGNVMLTRSGPKLLDFGLARALQDSSSEPAGESAGPKASTLTGTLTATGTILGTLQYMAPEQLEGKQADARADVFALGAVLYEMITGRRPFQGETQSSVIASILKDEPPPLGTSTPAGQGVERCLRRCLAKDREERWQSARDLMHELRWLAEEPRAETGGRSGSRRAPWVPLLVASVGVLSGVAIGWGMFTTRRPEPPSPVHLEVALPEGTRLNGWASPVVAMSPDGDAVAYVADREDGRNDLYVRRLDSPNAARVPDSETAEGPFFSPDGRWVGFAVGVSARTGRPGELLKYSLDTGLTQTICPLDDYFGALWGSGDEILFADAWGAGLWSVAASGGTKRQVLATYRLDGREEPRMLGWPAALPGGRHVLATDWGVVPSRIVVVDLGSGGIAELGIQGERAFFSDDGHLFFTDFDGTLFETPFDGGRRTPSGAPVALMDGISLSRNDVPILDVSNEGSLVYSRGFVRDSRIMPCELVHLDGAGSESVLPFEPQLIFRGITASPSGDRLAAASRDGSIWIYHVERGTRTKLPRGDAGSAKPWSIVWAPDGLSLAFSAFTAEGGWGLFRQRTSGSEEPETVLVENLPGTEMYAGSWTPDGKGIVYVRSDTREYRCSIRVKALEPDAEPEVLVDELNDTLTARLSPDGRWIAFDATDTGDFEVYVQDTSRSSDRFLVSSGGGRNPLWSPDGGELYYYDDNPARLLSVRAPGAVGEGFSPPRTVLQADVEGWFAVDSRGGFFGYRAVPSTGIRRHLNLIRNWRPRPSSF